MICNKKNVMLTRPSYSNMMPLPISNRYISRELQENWGIVRISIEEIDINSRIYSLHQNSSVCRVILTANKKNYVSGNLISGNHVNENHISGTHFSENNINENHISEVETRN